jgi:hypothetical protein
MNTEKKNHKLRTISPSDFLEFSLSVCHSYFRDLKNVSISPNQVQKNYYYQPTLNDLKDRDE